MRVEQQSHAILLGLHRAQVDFVVVGRMAGVLQAAPILTEDLDIVHRRTTENVARLLSWLLSHKAYARFDLANRRVEPRRSCSWGFARVARPARGT